MEPRKCLLGVQNTKLETYTKLLHLVCYMNFFSAVKLSFELIANVASFTEILEQRSIEEIVILQSKELFHAKQNKLPILNGILLP